MRSHGDGNSDRRKPTRGRSIYCLALLLTLEGLIGWGGAWQTKRGEEFIRSQPLPPLPLLTPPPPSHNQRFRPSTSGPSAKTQTFWRRICQRIILLVSFGHVSWVRSTSVSVVPTRSWHHRPVNQRTTPPPKNSHRLLHRWRARNLLSSSLSRRSRQHTARPCTCVCQTRAKNSHHLLHRWSARNLLSPSLPLHGRHHTARACTCTRQTRASRRGSSPPLARMAWDSSKPGRTLRRWRRRKR